MQSTQTRPAEGQWDWDPARLSPEQGQAWFCVCGGGGRVAREEPDSSADFRDAVALQSGWVADLLPGTWLPPKTETAGGSVRDVL